MVLRGDKARSVLEDFLITPSVEQPPVSQPPTVQDADPVRIAALEELRTSRTGYRRSRRLVVVDRREARLVREYRQFLAARGVTAGRFFCPSGMSDMYLDAAGEAEVIEAKSTAEHRHVRQALAQLLDYAPHSLPPPSASPPSSPSRRNMPTWNSSTATASTASTAFPHTASSDGPRPPSAGHSCVRSGRESSRCRPGISALAVLAAMLTMSAGVTAGAAGVAHALRARLTAAGESTKAIPFIKNAARPSIVTSR